MKPRNVEGQILDVDDVRFVEIVHAEGGHGLGLVLHVGGIELRTHDRDLVDVRRCLGGTRQIARLHVRILTVRPAREKEGAEERGGAPETQGDPERKSSAGQAHRDSLRGSGNKQQTLSAPRDRGEAKEIPFQVNNLALGRPTAQNCLQLRQLSSPLPASCYTRAPNFAGGGSDGVGSDRR